MRERIARLLEIARLDLLALCALGVAFSLDTKAANPLASKTFFFVLAAALVPAFTFLRFWWGQPVQLAKGPAVWALLALLASVTLSHLFSPLPGAGEASWRGWLLLGVLAVGLIDVFRDERSLRLTLRVLGGLALALGLWALVQALGLDKSAIGQVSNAAFGGRVAASLGNPNFLGGLLVILFPIACWLRVAEEEPRWRWLGGAAMVGALGAVSLTGSRAAWLGLAVELAVGAHLYYRSDAPEDLRRKSLSLFARLAAGLVLLLVLAPGGLARLKRAVDPKDQSVQFRLQTWEATLDMAAERPLLGWGPGSFSAAYPAYRLPSAMAWQMQHSYEVTHAENWPLHALAELGGLGLAVLVAFLMFLGLGLRPACRLWAMPGSHGHLAIALLSALAGTLACNLASLDLFLPSTFFFAAILLAMALSRFSAKPAGFGISPEPYASMLVSLAVLSVAALPPANAWLRWSASGLLASAKAQSQARNFGGAIPLYEKSLLGDPSSPEARYFLAASHQDRAASGDLDAAAAHYAKLRVSHPDYVLLHLKLAQLAEARGKKEDALAEYLRQTELDPYLSAAWQGAAHQLYLLDRKPEAEKALLEGLRHLPGDAGLMNNLGLVRVETGGLAEGLATYEELLKAHPENVDGRVNYAVSLLRAGRKQEAEAQAALVLKVQPDNAAARSLLRVSKGK